MKPHVREGQDGRQRCWWCGDDALYTRYHDREWGCGIRPDNRIFEKICLEGFQSGLSWLTILRKRENFRAAFADFECSRVARFTSRDVNRLLGDAGIVRHRGKIESTINNARQALSLIEEFGSLRMYLAGWFHESHAPELVSESPASRALSRDLKRRGWSFVGPTTMYAFMQAAGLVNDHLPGCEFRASAESARQRAWPATIRKKSFRLKE